MSPSHPLASVTVTVYSPGGILLTDSAIPIKFMVSNAEKMRVHSDGKIGINNTSPNRTVNITSVTGGNCDVELKAANNTGWCQLIFSDTDAAFRGGIGYELSLIHI